MDFSSELFTLQTYLVVVGFGGFFIFLWLRYRLKYYRNKRVSRIRKLAKDIGNIEPFPSDVTTHDEDSGQRDRFVGGVKTRFTVISRFLYIVVLFLWAAALAFPLIGNIPSTFLSIFVTIITVIVGIAARPFVENLISGIVISFSNQLRVGDTITIDGQFGTVEDISISHTKIKTWDWKRYIIPNSRMLTKEFNNWSIHETAIWAYVTCVVSYDINLEEFEEIAINAVRQSEHFEDNESPEFWTMELGVEGITCWVAAWVDHPSKAWTLKCDMRKRIAMEIRMRGLTTHLKRIEVSGSGESPDQLKPF